MRRCMEARVEPKSDGKGFEVTSIKRTEHMSLRAWICSVREEGFATKRRVDIEATISDPKGRWSVYEIARGFFIAGRVEEV